MQEVTPIQLECQSYEPEYINVGHTRYVPERTCRNVSRYCNVFVCDICGCDFDFLEGNAPDNGGMPNYCPNCGARVVI